jgi:hypothetical protein
MFPIIYINFTQYIHKQWSQSFWNELLKLCIVNGNNFVHARMGEEAIVTVQSGELL